VALKRINDPVGQRDWLSFASLSKDDGDPLVEVDFLLSHTRLNRVNEVLDGDAPLTDLRELVLILVYHQPKLLAEAVSERCRKRADYFYPSVSENPDSVIFLITLSIKTSSRGDMKINSKDYT
jgi:hypothetical protein